MGHGTTDAAAFGGKSVALNALSQDEYQELTTISIASFQIIKTLIIIIVIIINNNNNNNSEILLERSYIISARFTNVRNKI